MTCWIICKGLLYSQKLTWGRVIISSILGEGDIPMTVFQTSYGQYKFLVISFDLPNVPDTFLNLINRTFKSFMDSFVIVFIDDILVCTKTKEEHEAYFVRCWGCSRRRNYMLNILSFECCLSLMLFLWHIVSKEWVMVDVQKDKAIRNWDISTYRIDI